MSDMLQPTKPGSQVPYYAKINYENFQWLANSVYKFVKNFICHNLAWLKETGGAKFWAIKLPDAIVSISNRIDPATLSGRVINKVADVLTPLHALGGCASPLVAFAEVGSKFSALFSPYKTQVQYTVRGANDKTYKAQFPLASLEQKADKALGVADWALSFTGCASYIWRWNHSADEKFPLSALATWSGRYMSIGGLYFEGRFLYETLLVGKPQEYHATQEKYVPIKENATVAREEFIGSALRISLSVVCLSLDLFKAMATNGNQSPWLDTAIYCAGLAPTFITPVAMRYWPKMVAEPLYAAASA
jgi:hypothetical protein